ncbi:hypothetical protein MRX96_038961 [Rhipicephalus microplus]
MLDTEQLDNLLKDTPPSDVANGKAAEEHGDSVVAGGPSQEDRVCIHWSREGSTLRGEDTTTTSFEAHVRMRLSRPRLPEGRTVAESPRRENQMHGRGAAASQADQRSSSRRSASGRTSKSACPDCGGFSCDVTGIQTGGVTCGCDHVGCCCATSSEDEVQSAACSSESSGSCSSCSREDACKADASSTRDQSYSAGSVSSTSACSGCREPEIGTLLRTTASFCETLARALSGEQHATKRYRNVRKITMHAANKK